MREGERGDRDDDLHPLQAPRPQCLRPVCDKQRADSPHSDVVPAALLLDTLSDIEICIHEFIQRRLEAFSSPPSRLSKPGP